MFIAKKGLVLKAVSAIILTLTALTGPVNICFAELPTDPASHISCSVRTESVSNPSSALTADDYENDVDRLIALRFHPIDELLALANELEAKWRRKSWNQYALIMMHVCSEISNHKLNDTRLRQQGEHFAMIALSHSKMFDWQFHSELVEALGYQRSSATIEAWLLERRKKTQFWLQAWRRLETEIDPSFDIKDRENRPVSRVIPPEPLLPVGSPPSAVRDPKLREQYAAAIAENKKKSEKMLKQFPLQTRGPFFKTRAERVLIQLYSQPPFRNEELKRYLALYLRDAKARQRILDEVQTNSK